MRIREMCNLFSCFNHLLVARKMHQITNSQNCCHGLTSPGEPIGCLVPLNSKILHQPKWCLAKRKSSPFIANTGARDMTDLKEYFHGLQ
jgi:hypothetical protein